MSLSDVGGSNMGLTILRPLPAKLPPLRGALFDFDGTISTLRQGWEEVMEPLMAEFIAGPTPGDPELLEIIHRYIEDSAGIQTVYQMQWLAQKVAQYGRNPEVHDAWWYKAQYNRCLMERVEARLAELEAGTRQPEDFLIAGSRAFLQTLYHRGIRLYLASGTDHLDVLREAAALDVARYFTSINGAPAGRPDCSKEAVLRWLVEKESLRGPELLVVGDGKVEIALGVGVGARTLGVASDEVARQGRNPAKEKRLVQAGAHAICGDFLCASEILAWMGLS